MKSLTFDKFLTVGNSKGISKKAQVSQIIAYLLAIVIFAMVLVFGYKAVVNIRQQAEQANYLNFQKSLEADIKSIYFDYGSVKKESYSLSGYKEICFADLEHGFINSYPEKIISNIIKNSMESKIRKNVFLIGDKIDSFYIEKINLTNPLSQNPECVPVNNGKLNIKLTGQGDSSLVEKDIEQG